MLLEIPVISDTTDHAFVVYMLGIGFGTLFLVVFAIVAWLVNKVLTLWEAHITYQESRKTDIKEFEQLKASVEKLDASVRHLDGTIKNNNKGEGIINEKAMEILYELQEKLR
jgi:Na+-transporting methylmalonyl-CoA/oxaloacetate decarboxylase gamma subunit